MSKLILNAAVDKFLNQAPFQIYNRSKTSQSEDAILANSISKKPRAMNWSGVIHRVCLAIEMAGLSRIVQDAVNPMPDVWDSIWITIGTNAKPSPPVLKTTFLIWGPLVACPILKAFVSKVSIRGRSSTAFFGLFLTTSPHVFTLTKSRHFWAKTYLSLLVNIVCDQPLIVKTKLIIIAFCIYMIYQYHMIGGSGGGFWYNFETFTSIVNRYTF